MKEPQASYTMFTCKSQPGWWEQPIFEQFAAHLTSRGLPTQICKVDHFKLKNHGFLRRKFKFRHFLAFLQNDKTGHFHVLDCQDWVEPFAEVRMEDILQDKRCQVYLKCQYRDEPFQKYPFTKIKPWTYFGGHTGNLQPLLDECRRTPRYGKALYFRGNTEYHRRGEILAHLQQNGTLNSDFRKIEFYQYIEESCRHRLILALPGMGNLCHREIEGFGMGTPVLMPRLENRLHNNLVPDHHYISVDVNTGREDCQTIAGKIERRYRQVIDDTDFLGFVAGNAARWYDENVRFPHSLDLTARLLGLL